MLKLWYELHVFSSNSAVFYFMPRNKYDETFNVYHCYTKTHDIKGACSLYSGLIHAKGSRTILP